ncbi:unnamed protein product [Rangifer tarandus platyrhynchus]|uniref:Uncharacterized protein n=2 Tax=Rangifer tarandus platyrhynchus TaxID=3082113 RepID=A0ABN8YPH3_RANTA|nr:unnamed protein product [Rangifer tarandus platyrhynchus]
MVISGLEILKSEEFSRKSELWKSPHSLIPHPPCLFRHSYQQCISSILFMFFFFFLCECIVALNASVICRMCFSLGSGFQFCSNSIITFPAVSVFIKSGFISKAGLTTVVLFN